LQEVRAGFERPFWVANISEIFERISYYGCVRLASGLSAGETELFHSANRHAHGIFRRNGLVSCNFRRCRCRRLGFRRALALAYLILAGAYFLIGSIGAPWLARRGTRFRSYILSDFC